MKRLFCGILFSIILKLHLVASSAIESLSVDTQMWWNKFEVFNTVIVWASNEIPSRCFRFLFGIPLEPPRANIKACTSCSELIRI